MEQHDFFVAHQFTAKQRDDLRDAIGRAFRRTGLKPYYADIEVRESGVHILEKITERITHSLFGIYDITSTEKPNVFVELGIAMATQRPYYIISEKGTPIPADLAGLDRIEYSSYMDLIRCLRKHVVPKEVDRLRQLKKVIESSYSEYDVLPEPEVLRRAIKIYQAENLHHRVGYREEDRNASNGTAWVAPLSRMTHVIYGPYEELSKPGSYAAFFKMKIDQKFYSMDAILTLDVSNLNPRSIYAFQFREPNKYQLFGVAFKYAGGYQLEYRAYALGLGPKVWIDYVAVAEWAALPQRPRNDRVINKRTLRRK